MSASTEFQGFPKKEEFILSYNKIWDIYEVAYDKITPFAIPNTACHIPKGLSSIYYVIANKNNSVHFGLFDKDITFHWLMSNGLGDSGYRMEDGDLINIMFGPKTLKPTFEKLLNLVNSFEGRSDYPFHEWEKKSLECILVHLDKIIEEDGMVSLIYG